MKRWLAICMALLCFNASTLAIAQNTSNPRYCLTEAQRDELLILRTEISNLKDQADSTNTIKIILSGIPLAAIGLGGTISLIAALIAACK